MQARRYLFLTLLYLALILTPLLFERRGPERRRPRAPQPVPAEALEALRQGRYWRASLILRDYLALAPDTAPETVLLAARAAAGAGDWALVEELLGGRDWLDRIGGGDGWNLLGRSRLELGRWPASGEALRRFLAVAPHTGQRERGLAEVRRGLALAKAGTIGEALAAFSRAEQALPQLGDWIQIFAASAAAQVGDTAEVRKRLADADPVLAREWGWRIRVRALQTARDTRSALLAAEAAANGLDDAGRRAEAWAVTGELRLLLRDTAGARAAFRRAMEAAPMSEGALTAARVASTIPGLSPEEHLRIGRLYLRHGNLDRGIAGLQAYLASATGSPVERGEVRLELGRALFRAGRYADAERLFVDLGREAPSPRIGADALLLAGRAQYRQGREAESRATFLSVARRFPRERAAAEALFLVADLDHDAGRLASAREFYLRVARSGHDTDVVGLAHMRLGGMAFVARDFEGAAATFDGYRRHYPQGKRHQQATYWAARAYLELGKRDLARARLEEVRALAPFSYYGIRAAELLGKSFWDGTVEPSPPPNPRTRAEVEAALARVDLLREIGWEDAAAFEVERVKRHLLRRDGAIYTLAEAFNERGYTFAGIQLGWEIFRREGAWNLRLLRIIYPFPYRNLIVAEARERGLDPFFVAGLIRQESMFDAVIKSPVGAVGLMQIMPRTGEELARKAGLTGFDPSILQRPEINLHLGMLYIAELMQRFGNRLPSVLAAYNAGPHRVARWRQYPEYQDEELFAERIPFEETRDYVKVVQQNAFLYQALYGGSPNSSQGD